MATIPATFDACLALCWQFDGLKDDRAQGEQFATSYGVTEMTWQMAEDQGIVDHDIETATKADCANILRVMYWNATHCPSLWPGVNLMVFNDSMVTGVGHTAKLLQRLVGAEQDGVIGPNTLRLANAMHAVDLIEKLRVADETYYAALAKAPLFLKGWTRREEFMAAQAKLMAAG